MYIRLIDSTLCENEYFFRLNDDNTLLHDYIPPEKVVTLSLCHLEHGNLYLTIGANFGLGKSDVK